jgi:hypothetical protein
LPYELEVVERLRPWAQVVGATVEHVGGDNQASDVLVRFSQASIAGRDRRRYRGCELPRNACRGEPLRLIPRL